MKQGIIWLTQIKFLTSDNKNKISKKRKQNKTPKKLSDKIEFINVENFLNPKKSTHPVYKGEYAGQDKD